MPTTMTPPITLIRALLSAPPEVLRRLMGPPPELDGQVLAPSVQLLLAMARLTAGANSEEDRPDRRRALLRRSTGLAMPRPRGVDTRDLAIPGPGGLMAVRVYRPRGSQGGLLPGLVYYHGGGWVVGDLDTHDNTCRALAIGAGAAVVSIDYRLAPEHVFPAAVDDATEAFRWVRDHPEMAGIESGRVGVMGDSAGGNLAALVCHRLRDADEPGPVAQGLVYPATDLRRTSRSTSLFADGYYLTKADVDWYVGQYLPEPAFASDPQASPLLAHDLSGLPPAGVWTAGFDPLRDEGNDYAERLRDAGVPVRHRCYRDQVHGFLGMGVLPDGMRRITEVAATTGGLLRM